MKSIVKQRVPYEARTRGGILKYSGRLKTESQRHRKIPTEMELLFWKIVLSKDKTGYRFLRQKPIGRFIIDFYCPKLSLAIEIDGSSHNNKLDYDAERDKYLAIRGVTTIRYTNNMVGNNIEKIIRDLNLWIKNREIELEIN